MVYNAESTKVTIPPFISNHEDERANPAKLGGWDAAVPSVGLRPLLLDFTGFVTTCSIPIIDKTRLPRLAIRGDGSLAKVHIVETHCEYNALFRGLGLEWLTAPLLTVSSCKTPESECWYESSESGDPCITPVLARGLLVETLPSLTKGEFSFPNLNNGPIWEETMLAWGTCWFELV